MPDRTIAFIGAGLLFLGAFLPVVRVPIAGPLTYYQSGTGDGVIVLLLAAATAVLAGMRKTRLVLWTGAAALALIAYSFVRLQSEIAETRERIETDLADNPFRGIAEAAVNSVQLQWGWAVLMIAAAMVIYAGWNARRAPGRTDRDE